MSSAQSEFLADFEGSEAEGSRSKIPNGTFISELILTNQIVSKLRGVEGHMRVVKGYLMDPGQQGVGDNIPTLLDAVDTLLISPVFFPFDIAKVRKITDNIYKNPDSCVL